MGGRSLDRREVWFPCSLLQAEHQLHGGVCSGAVPEQAAHPAGTALTVPVGQEVERTCLPKT